MEDLEKYAKSFARAIPAVQFVEILLAGRKTAPQCRDALKYWNHKDGWDLPIRKLAAGRAALAVETPVQLRALAARCVQAGADANEVAAATERIAPLLQQPPPAPAAQATAAPAVEQPAAVPTCPDALLAQARSGAVPALAIVEFTLGTRTSEQCRAILKKWNHDDGWRLPQMHSTSGKWAVLAVTSVPQLSAVLSRCVRTGGDGSRAAQLAALLELPLSSNGAGPSTAGAPDDTTAPHLADAQPAHRDEPAAAGGGAAAGPPQPQLQPPTNAVAPQAFPEFVAALWKDRGAPAQASVVVHGMLPHLDKGRCHNLVLRWQQEGKLRLGTALFKRARDRPSRALALDSAEDLVALVLRCRAECAEPNLAGFLAGVRARVTAGLADSTGGTSPVTFREPASKAAAKAARAQAEVQRLQQLRADRGTPEPAPAQRRRGAGAARASPDNEHIAGLDGGGGTPVHHRHPDGLWARSWRGRGRRAWDVCRWALRWNTLRQFLTLYVCCALCGFTAYPTGDEMAKWGMRTPRPGETPPHELYNSLHSGVMAAPDGSWMLCPTCAGKQQQDGRAEHVVFHTPDYARQVVRLDPSLQMLLSLVNVGAGFAANAKGYFTARLQQPHAVGAAMLAWDDSAAERAKLVPDGVREVLGWSLAFNPIYQAYLSVIEQRGQDASQSFLGPEAVASFAADAIARSPVAYMLPEHNEMCKRVLAAVMPTLPPPLSLRAPPTSYTAGTLHPRAGLLGAAAVGGALAVGGNGHTQPQVIILPDGSAAASSAAVGGQDLLLTAELAMFPYLFPFGSGAFGGSAMAFSEYLQFRARCFLSVWTLVQPYLLLMFAVRTTTQLYGGHRTKVVLERAIAEYRKRHPDANDEKLIKHIIKHSLPSTLPNTPSWHRRNLQDLLALVDRWGLPTHFLTLTADEFSTSRWEEVETLEDMVRKFCTGATWRDAPAENAYLFHRRIQMFMREILRVRAKSGGKGESGVLGRVQHHVTRYEVQGRQSLHAHILLWVHPDDVDRVSSEIVACVPAKYVGKDGVCDEHDPNCPNGRECWEAPTEDPHAHALFDHVMSKQVHFCTPIKRPGCRKQGTCRYGFPWKPHDSPVPVVDPATRRYVYYRPSWAHRNVSPYHPTVALLWGAHMNLQRITSSDWSFYVLKYAMKTEPSGNLNLTDASRVALGLPEDQPGAAFSTTYLVKIISAYLTSTALSPTLAFLGCAQINTVFMSSGVDFVCSAPPTTRTRTVFKGAKLCACPVDMYSLRPTSLTHVTFTSYFRDYRLVSTKAPRGWKAGAQRTAAGLTAVATAATAAAGGMAAVVTGGLGAAAALGVAAAAGAAGATVAGAAARAAGAAAGTERGGPVLRQAPPGGELVGQTQDRHFNVYKLREPRIVRFTDYNPASDPEGYFYNLLLQHAPFAKESDLITAENESGTYFEECRLRKLVQNTSDLEVHLQSYANYHLYNAQRRQALLATLLGKYTPSEATDDGDELNPEAAAFTVSYGGLRDPPQGTARPRGRGRAAAAAAARGDSAALKAALAAEFEELDEVPYTEAQEATVEAILRHRAGVIVLTGGPGSGKTFTTKKLTRQLRQMGKTVMLTASTGAAAVRLSAFATTNHGAFDLPSGTVAMSSWVMGTSDVHPKAEALRSADVFIIDEFSMMTDAQLTLVLTRIFHACHYATLDEMLANKLIILVGDHAQLPPVCNCAARAGHSEAVLRAAAPQAADAGPDDLPLCESCHIASNPFFCVAPKYRLPASVRHAKDPEFAAFLDIIRVRPPTAAEIDSVFGPWSPAATLTPTSPDPAACSPYYISEDMVALLSDERTTVLCTHVADAKAYNHAILERLAATGVVGDVQPCPMQHDVPARSVAEAGLETWLRDESFKTIEQVAVGARVVLVENCDLRKGAANGAAGVVVQLSYKARDDGVQLVSGVKVRLTDSGKCLWIGQRTSLYNWFSGVKYSKHAFPLTLGWAITAHRAQGATLTGGTIIHARSVFTPGQLYVMLSRVTERRLLRLVGPLRPNLFTPVRLPNFVQIDALAEKQRAMQVAAFAAAATAVLVVTATHLPAAPAEPMDLDGLD